MTTYRLRVLHLSDLHATGVMDWRRRRVLGEAWERNLDDIAADGPIDIVCFTGDAAFSGGVGEYDEAETFFHAVLSRLGIGWDAFFIVPGNHDVDRNTEKGAWEALRRDLPRADALEVAQWMTGRGAPLGFSDDQRDAVLSRQDAYRRWLHRLGRTDLLPDAGPHPTLGWRVSRRFRDHPFETHMIGLDSAWLAGDNHDAGKLRLTDEQVGRLTMTETGDALSGLLLALIHHPLDDLADGAECRRLLAGAIDVVLRGHLHETEPSLWADPARRLPQLAAGCLYETDRYPNACQVIEIETDATGRPLAHHLWFRGWSSRGHWYDDASLYADSRGGRLTLRIDGPLADGSPAEANPDAAERFVRRAEALTALAAALLPADGRARPVAVRGMPGVGKSFLIDGFYYRNEAAFPGGYRRLVIDPLAQPSGEVLIAQLAEALLPAGSGVDITALSARLIEPRTLLHIENADSEDASGAAARVVSALPECAIAVSARWQALGNGGGWASPIDLVSFEEADGLALLAKELGADGPDRNHWPELVLELGGLPLALHLAAGHLRTLMSVADVLAELRAGRYALGPADAANWLGMAAAERASLAATFGLSLTLLERQGGGVGAAWRRGLIGLAHGPAAGVGASLGAALAGLDDAAFRRLKAAAARLSLLTAVERQPGRPAWTLHPLLAQWLRAEDADGADAGTGGGPFERMSQWFLQRLPATGDAAQRDCWGDVHVEAAGLADWLERLAPERRPEAVTAGMRFAITTGPFLTWQAFLEAMLGDALPDAVRSDVLWTLGNVAYQGGDRERALAAAEETRALVRARGADREAAHAAGLIAHIEQDRGELDEALRILTQERLPVYERLGDVRSRAVTLGHIADINFARGDLDEALRICTEEQLPVYERLGDVRARAVTLGKIADIKQARGDLDEALRIYSEDVLPACEHLGDVRARAVTLSKIADIRYVRGDLDEALRIHSEEVLPAFERLGDVRERAVSLGRIADISEARGDADEALRIRTEEQLPVYERLGDVRARAVTLGKLADIIQARGGLDEALRIRTEEVLPAFERLGDVRERAITLGKIADIIQARGGLDEALRIRTEEELPVYKRLGDVRSRAVTLGKIADIAYARGDLDEALRIRTEEELPVYKRLGDVRSRAVTLGKIADIAYARGDLDEALRIRTEEELPVYERLGDVRSRAVTLGQIADISEARDDLDEALRIRTEEQLPVYERLGDVRGLLGGPGECGDDVACARHGRRPGGGGAVAAFGAGRGAAAADSRGGADRGDHAGERYRAWLRGGAEDGGRRALTLPQAWAAPSSSRQRGCATWEMGDRFIRGHR